LDIEAARCQPRALHPDEESLRAFLDEAESGLAGMAGFSRADALVQLT
jgi:hypothetical protein